VLGLTFLSFGATFLSFQDAVNGLSKKAAAALYYLLGLFTLCYLLVLF
jgi:hypothetical protein